MESDEIEGGLGRRYKKPKIEKIVKASLNAVEESLVGVLNETIGGVTPPSRPTLSQAATCSSVIDLCEDDLFALRKSKSLTKLSTSKAATKTKFKPKTMVIGICKMERSRKGGIKKAGDYYEVPLAENDSYSQCVNKAIHTLSWDYNSSEEHPCLCRLNGCRILDADVSVGGRRLPWTLSNYVKAISLKTHQIRLGIAMFQNMSSSEEEGFPSHLCKEKHTKKDATINILYAAKIGSCGIDTHSIKSREDLWLDKHSTLALINTPIPWYPELGAYAVCQISLGGVKVLSYVNGGFIVKDDNKESFCIVHQSPTEHTLAIGEVVALFCVASQHSFRLKYTWDNMNGEVGINSPICFANKSGVYRCTVESDGRKCYSKSIFITEKGREDSSGEDSGSKVPPEDFTNRKSTCTTIKSGSTRSIPPSESTGTTSKHPGCGNGLRVFEHSELVAATTDFKNLIGKGGFGKVYKGEYHGTEIAVKVLSEEVDVITDSPKGTLMTEIDNLTRFRHPNLIELMGFCETPPCLVYPYMSKLSLFHCLHKYKVENPLSWENRVSILHGTAKGLVYLHSSQPPFLHQDVKSHNILLDDWLHPRVADFGFATPLPSNIGSTKLLTVCGSVRLAGTRGYVAPEFNDGRRGVKTDVYMYGIVVLETFTGLVAFSEQREEENLLDHCKDEGMWSGMSVFVSLGDSKVGVPAENTSRAFFEVIDKTTKHSHKKRCSMDEVIQIWKRVPE